MVNHDEIENENIIEEYQHGSEEYQHGSTIMGLHKWYCSVFEKLGWMLLCRNDVAKVKVYYKGIQKLRDQLEVRMNGSPAPDTQKDLSYMIANTRILLAHIEKDFASEISQRIELTGGAKKATKSKSKTKGKSNSNPKGKSKSKSKSKAKVKGGSKSKAVR